MAERPPGKFSVYSPNTKPYNAKNIQTHSIRNGLPVEFARTSGPVRTRTNLQSRLDAIRQAIANKK